MLLKNKKMINKYVKFDMVNFVANLDLSKLTNLVINKALIKMIPNTEASIYLHLGMHEVYGICIKFISYLCMECHKSKFLVNCYCKLLFY